MVNAKLIWTEEYLLSRCPFSSSKRSYLLWDVAQIMSKDAPIWPYSDPNLNKQQNIHGGNTRPLNVPNNSERILAPACRWQQREETLFFKY